MLSIGLKSSYYSDKDYTHHQTELDEFVANILEKINAYKNVLNTDRQYSKVGNSYPSVSGGVWDYLK